MVDPLREIAPAVAFPAYYDEGSAVVSGFSISWSTICLIRSCHHKFSLLHRVRYFLYLGDSVRTTLNVTCVSPI